MVESVLEYSQNKRKTKHFMAIKELQTAAVRVVHVVRPSENDIAELDEQFHFHPLDREAMLVVNGRSALERYADYVMAVWRWPVFDARRREWRLTDIHLVIGKDYIVLVDHAGSPLLGSIVNETISAPAHQQDTSALLAYEVIMGLLKSLPVDQLKYLSLTLREHVGVIEELQATLLERTWLATEEEKNAFTLALHFARHLRDVQPAIPPQGMPQPSPLTRLRTLVTGYAVVAACMIATATIVAIQQ